ncbi:MAG TPA: hypothetical protein DCL77_01925 [Prolixibacteraceae bacterium]|nr:hypothetical protein [Prolixibacteraceae bacterium]
MAGKKLKIISITERGLNLIYRESAFCFLIHPSHSFTIFMQPPPRLFYSKQVVKKSPMHRMIGMKFFLYLSKVPCLTPFLK